MCYTQLGVSETRMSQKDIVSRAKICVSQWTVTPLRMWRVISKTDVKDGWVCCVYSENVSVVICAFKGSFLNQVSWFWSYEWQDWNISRLNIWIQVPWSVRHRLTYQPPETTCNRLAWFALIWTSVLPSMDHMPCISWVSSSLSIPSPLPVIGYQFAVVIRDCKCLCRTGMGTSPDLHLTVLHVNCSNVYCDSKGFLDLHSIIGVQS